MADVRRVESALTVAVELWLEENGPPPWAFGDAEQRYSSVDNRFVHLAESVMCRVVAERYPAALAASVPSAGVHVVYRHWRGTELLYIGVTSNYPARARAHRHSAPWAPDITSTTFETFCSRQEADNAEKAAIRTEHPRWNMQRLAWVD